MGTEKGAQHGCESGCESGGRIDVDDDDIQGRLRSAADVAGNAAPAYDAPTPSASLRS